MKERTLFISILLFSLWSYGDDNIGKDIVVDYQLQSGDLISELLLKLKVTPKWGKTGYVQKTYEANPSLFAEQGYKWKAGEWIKLVLPYRSEDYPDLKQSLRKPSSYQSSYNRPKEPYQIHIYLNKDQIQSNPIVVKVDPSQSYSEFQYETSPLSKKTLSKSSSVSWGNLINEGHLNAKARTGFSNLKAKDSSGRSAELNSGQSFGVDLNWAWSVGESQLLDITYSLDIYDFESNANLLLNQDQSHYHNFQIGSKTEISDKSFLQFGFGLGQKNFVTSLTDQSVNVKSQWAPKFYFNFSHEFYEYRKWSFSGDLGLSLVLPQEYSEIRSETGTEQRVNLSAIKASAEKSLFGGGVYLLNQNQDSRSFGQSQVSYGLQFFIKSNFDGGIK